MCSKAYLGVSEPGLDVDLKRRRKEQKRGREEKSAEKLSNELPDVLSPRRRLDKEDHIDFGASLVS